MLHESDAQRAVALKNASKLSPSDAAAVFEALVAQMERQEDGHPGDRVRTARETVVREVGEVLGE
jgi:hypothetical protein